nr:halo-toxin - Pseudomonas syringae pv. mori [Pseudomonas amygdali pv. mori]
PFPGPI